MNRLLKLALPAATLALLSGCSETTPLVAGPAPPAGTPSGVQPPTIAEQAFQRPAPSNAGQDPRIVSATAANDSVSRSLAVIHERMVNLKAALANEPVAAGDVGLAKVATEDDLRRVAEQMQPLLVAARADCDAILRAAQDLKAEIPTARRSYEASAELYRERADRYRDPDHRELMLAWAAEFERQAGEVPRRIRLTDEFIARLEDTREFLAETDRCLKDTAAALAILSAGPESPISAGGRSFRRRLEEFLGLVEEYRRTFLGLPPEPPGRHEPIAPSPAPVTPAVFDVLREGAMLAGQVQQAGQGFPMGLLIQRRSGDEFSGELQFQAPGGPRKLHVSGKAEGAAFTMVGVPGEAADAPGPVHYRGRIEGNTLSGSWEEPGTGAAGGFTLAIVNVANVRGY
jgi:hypothetical protein